MARSSRNSLRTQKGGMKNTLRSILIFIVLVVIIWAVDKYVVPYLKEKGILVPTTEQVDETTAEKTSTQTVDESGQSQAEEPVVKKNKSDKKKKTSSKEVNAPSLVGDNQIVKHNAFTLSYNNEHEQADWVFYLLTQSMVNGKTGRTNDFREDPSVKLVSAYTEDYTGTGYDRGHLCPSADVKLDETSQSETFYMSNMSPQAPAFNRGIWKKLEEQTRRWVGRHDSIYIATGPVLKKGLKTIGKTTKISVPDEYYKILYTPSDGGHMIAFLLPNDGCKGHVYTDYIVSVDEVEKATGIDFFHDIIDEDILEEMKSTTDWWN